MGGARYIGRGGSRQLRLGPEPDRHGGRPFLDLGGGHVCALDSHGDIYCWGDNSRQQAGAAANVEEVAAPRKIGLATDFVAVAAGDKHTCAIGIPAMGDPQVYCWGENRSKQSNPYSTNDEVQPLPVGIEGIDVNSAASVGAGVSHSCVRTLQGTVTCWGNSDRNRLGSSTTMNIQRVLGPVDMAQTPPTLLSISLGGEFGCGIESADDVVDATRICWGDVPDVVADDTNTARDGAAGRISVAVSVGHDHGCAIVCSVAPNVSLCDGLTSLVCFGSNNDSIAAASRNYKLGNDSSDRSRRGVVVDGFNGVTAVAAGTEHTCALDANGTVHCWGDNTIGELGLAATGPMLPSAAGGLGTYAQIAAGDRVTCGITDVGELYCWGANDAKQISGAEIPGSHERQQVVHPSS